MTVTELLQMQCLLRAEPKVLTENLGKDRRIRWVHSSEALDIGQFLRGGEVILTTGIELVRVDAERRRRYIKDLCSFGASGLIIERNRALTRIPREIVEMARTLNLPVITVAPDTSFMEITEQVHSAIVNEHQEMLQWVQEAERSLNELARDDATLTDILDYVAGQVQALVVLEDEAHQIVAVSRREHYMGDLIADWDSHSRREQLRPGLGTQHFDASQDSWGVSSCVTTSVWLRQELWGRLHVLTQDRGVTEQEGLLIERASAVVSMRLLVEAHSLRSQVTAHSALLSDVLGARGASNAEIIARARALGVELQRRDLYAFVMDYQSLSPSRGLEVLDEEERQLRLETLVQAIQANLLGDGTRGIVGNAGRRIVGLVAVAGQDGAHLEQRFLAVRLRAEELLAGQDLVIGVSDPVATVEDLRRAFAQAETAVSYGIATRTRVAVTWYGELGLGGLLMYASRGPELARFVERELGALLQSDEGRASRLMTTLRTLFFYNMNKVAAAADLGVDRRTLYRRVETIERILGRKLDDHRNWLRVAVALEGLEILRARQQGLLTDFSRGDMPTADG